MNVVGINGSSRLNGNTAKIIEVILEDTKGIANMKNLGHNMAWTLFKLLAPKI